ncbi:hypothetical protein [Clostridium estertheticum]|uniref:hypothetical protein n=1 Tax=Clostridium estertheticum TaxID=238834 RepID=UPI001C7D681C|nr:hypothetical protein [Clostridium estertheticum]MBX4263126.1 hypothetical protein [Clostridium estertheticum]WLC89439.1 hypothetical protein KTC95_04250 [Clostridium estertheticum]
MSTWSSSQQVCASCRYWCGRRNIDFMACFFEALGERGICEGPDGSFRGIETNEGSSCTQWETFRK